MQIAAKIIIATILFFSSAGIVKADIAPPSKLTTFYFQKNGQPFMQLIKFTVKCYGTNAMDNADKVLKISEFSETCQTYGCKFDTANVFEAYRQNTKYCDLEGEANGEKFAIKDFLGAKMSGLNCHRADYTISTGDNYFKETPRYKDCQKDVYREYYPSGNGEVKGDFLCAKYETDDYLIPTALSTEPNGECYRYGYTIKNNKCYKIPDEFFTCTAGEDQKMKLCDQYLEDVTSKLAKGKNGFPFEEICEVKINVPISISNQPTLLIDQPQSKDIFSRIIDFFKCFF